MASAYGFLGSLDANAGDPLLGWDVDLFHVDHREATLMMRYRVTHCMPPVVLRH
jgi:xylose isomerase